MTNYSAFADLRHHLYTGPDLESAVAAAHRAYATGAAENVLVFDDATGERTEITRDGRCPWLESAPKRGPGRPKLGVISREVSLLPRHWDWLNTQPNGASAALRRLVDEARKTNQQRDAARIARDAAYRFISIVGGDLPGFEEAARALYAGRFEDASALIGDWPADLSAHVRRLIEVARDAALQPSDPAPQSEPPVPPC